MSTNDNRESWAMVPGSAELWASNTGKLATLRDGGFNILTPRKNQYGEPCLRFKREGGGHKEVRLVASMVLHAHNRPRIPGCRIGYGDGDPSNVALKNLSWERKGQARAVDLTERLCLGTNCGAKFMSSGSGNRLCPSCAKRANSSTSNIFEDAELGALPDEPLCGTGGNPHR